MGTIKRWPIGSDRTVQIYDEEMPQEVREKIKRIADTSEMTVSPPRIRRCSPYRPRAGTTPQKKKPQTPIPHWAEVLRLIGEFDAPVWVTAKMHAQAVENIAQQLHDPVQREESIGCFALSLTMPAREEESGGCGPSAWSRSRLPPALTPEQADRGNRRLS